MINLNINFYLMKTIFTLTYFYIYALQNALSLCWETNLSDSNTLCIVATCVPKAGKTCYPTDLLPLIIFSLIKQKWGNWGICGELFPRNWGNARWKHKSWMKKEIHGKKNTQNMPISLLYLPFFQSKNISSGKQEMWLNSVYSYLSSS